MPFSSGSIGCSKARSSTLIRVSDQVPSLRNVRLAFMGFFVSPGFLFMPSTPFGKNEKIVVPILSVENRNGDPGSLPPRPATDSSPGASNRLLVRYLTLLLLLLKAYRSRIMPRSLGLASLKILAAIRDGSAYGLEIVARTGLPSGTVYPTLGRLRRSGFLHSRWEDRRRAEERRVGKECRSRWSPYH